MEGVCPPPPNSASFDLGFFLFRNEIINVGIGCHFKSRYKIILAYSKTITIQENQKLNITTVAKSAWEF